MTVYIIVIALQHFVKFGFACRPVSRIRLSIKIGILISTFLANATHVVSSKFYAMAVYSELVPKILLILVLHDLPLPSVLMLFFQLVVRCFFLGFFFSVF